MLFEPAHVVDLRLARTPHVEGVIARIGDGEIADQFHISKPSISHHLDLLKQADLVVAVKEGQFIYYSINTTVLDEMLKWMITLTGKKKK